MTIEKLNITNDCHFEVLYFEDNPTRFTSLEYVEHSPDAWYSDSSKSVDIDQTKAQEIVDFLCKHFNIKPTLP